jgi:hypothetical protein
MNLKVSVNKIEGFFDILSNAGCYLSVDGDFIDVITPITSASSEYLTEIPAEGVLKFIIKNMRSGDVIGSVSIRINCLKPGNHWLPLFDDIEDDLVNSIPVDVDSPKIEVSFITGETDTVTLKPQVSPNSDLRLEKLQQEYDSSLKRAEERDFKHFNKIQELQQDFNKLSNDYNSTQLLLEKKDLEIVHLTEKLKKAAIENYESEYLISQDLILELKSQVAVAEDRINSLEKELEQSNSLTSSLTSIKSNLYQIHEEENQRLLLEITQLKQKILEMQKTSEKKLSDKLEAELIKQIKDLDEKLENSELSKQELISELNDLKQEILNQDKLINDLKFLIEGSKTDRISIRDDRSKSPKALRRKDSIDRSLDEYHAGQGIKNNFVKFARGIYEFGNRKVNVSIKNGSIICRVGGGYVQIDDFLQIYMGSLSGSPKKVYHRNQSTSPNRNLRSPFTFLESTSGKQTPLDSVFDGESILTYSCDSEDDKNREYKRYR